MKTFKLLMLTVFSISTLFANSQTKKETIHVLGNCGMCQARIEQAAKDAGATTAIYNQQTKSLAVSYDIANTSLSTIEEKIALAGHDSKNKSANSAAYNKLHGCCKYEREEAIASIATSTENCCIGSATCCASGSACCSNASIAADTVAKDCCVSGASCCAGGSACCSSTSVATNTIAKDCCASGAACCATGSTCCSNSVHSS